MLGRLALALALLAVSLAAASPAGGEAPTDAGAGTIRERAVSWAVEQVGTREIGTTNCSKAIKGWQRDMRLEVPPCRVWCGAFVHQAFRQAGAQLSSRMIDPDRSYRDAVAGRRGLRSIPIDEIERGDIVFSRFVAGVKASHMGIARAKPSGGVLLTVDGNTDNAVRLASRGMRHVVLAARVTRGN